MPRDDTAIISDIDIGMIALGHEWVEKNSWCISRTQHSRKHALPEPRPPPHQMNKTALQWRPSMLHSLSFIRGLVTMELLPVLSRPSRKRSTSTHRQNNLPLFPPPVSSPISSRLTPPRPPAPLLPCPPGPLLHQSRGNNKSNQQQHATGSKRVR